MKVTCAIAMLAFTISCPVSAQWNAPNDYYESATGSGRTLKNQLTSIMTIGHFERRYGDFRFSTAIHDQDPDNPSRIVLAYNRASVNSTWDSGATYNREHVWPQSRQPGSASNSTRGNLGDPHALFPCNPGVNSSRGNKPFGNFDSIGPFMNLGASWFPGDECKGDIARSLFYSDTRWTSLGLSLVDGVPTGNQMGDLSSLVAWHYLDPPDEFERRRNHTIYSDIYNPEYFTNNRNAFVDRPEFVWSIYVNQANDASITLQGGQSTTDSGSILNVNFGSIIVGAQIESVVQSVTLNKSGIGGTYYSVETLENATSELNGFDNAFRANKADATTFDVGLNFDPDTPANYSGLVVIDNLDITDQGGAGQGANDENDIVDMELKVKDHANASFSEFTVTDLTTLDLGDLQLGLPIEPVTFEIYNLASAQGAELTASLDLISISADNANNSLTVNGPLFTNLASGTSQQMSISGFAENVGSFTTIFEFELRDEDVPGATTKTLFLTIQYDVVDSFIIGDVNQDGVVNLLDIQPFVQILGDGSFLPEADTNQDGEVNLLDVDPFIQILQSS